MDLGLNLEKLISELEIVSYIYNYYIYLKLKYLFNNIFFKKNFVNVFLL